jgi:hypothetical protein
MNKDGEYVDDKDEDGNKIPSGKLRHTTYIFNIFVFLQLFN